MKLPLVKFVLLLAVLMVSPLSSASDSEQNKKSIDAVSIIGNTELPNVTFELPWKLPSITKREEQKPKSDLEGMLEMIEPERHRQQVFFNQHLKLDAQ